MRRVSDHARKLLDGVDVRFFMGVKCAAIKSTKTAAHIGGGGETAAGLHLIEAVIARFWFGGSSGLKEDSIESALKGQEVLVGAKGGKRHRKRIEEAQKLAELTRVFKQAADDRRLGDSYILEDVVLDDIRKHKPKKQVETAKKALIMSARLGKKPCFLLRCKYVPPGELPIKQKKIRKAFKKATKELLKDAQTWELDPADPYAYGRQARKVIAGNDSYNIIKYGFDLSEEREVYNRIYHPDKHLIPYN